MKGKRVLVTGSGTGLGRETALEFARRGADVVLHYSRSQDGAASALDEIQKMGRRVAAFSADLSQIANVRRLVRDAADFLGGLDVLVNNAGATLTLEFEEVTAEQFDFLYNLNVGHQYFAIQTALPIMLAQETKGTVVNLASIHGFRAFKGHSVYAGTKGAIIAMTRELAVELAPKGIRINAVAPGAVPVENHFKEQGNDDTAGLAKCLPCGFAGRPIDIANVVCFLASDQARYIYGQTILVDGGTSSWMAFNDGFHETGLRLGKGYVPGL